MAVPVLPDTFFISKTVYGVEYTPNKTYLGRNQNLERETYINLRFIFKTEAERLSFFDFWVTVLNNGSKAFYANLLLFGKSDYYLISQFGSLSQEEEPRSLSAKFILFLNKTLDENTAPIASDIDKTFNEGSKNNYILLDGVDYDGNTLRYSLVTAPTHGEVTVLSNGGAIYTPTTAYEGTDFFEYRCYDGLEYSNTARVDITLLARDTELFYEKDGLRFVPSGSTQMTVKENA